MPNTMMELPNATPAATRRSRLHPRRACRFRRKILRRFWPDHEQGCHDQEPADRGYTQIRSLSTHKGCYEAKGIDSKGHRFELELNGATGAIANAE